MDGNGPFVPLGAVERLERAQLEILAMQLFAMENQRTGDAWQKITPHRRDNYRSHAHLLMQGLEPAHWRQKP